MIATFLWVTTPSYLPYVIGGCVFVAAAAGAFLFWCLRRRKTTPAPMPDARIEKLIALLGGIANVADVQATGGRAAFTLADLGKADLEGIRALGAEGVFVVGKTVKALFPFALADLPERFGKGSGR